MMDDPRWDDGCICTVRTDSRHHWAEGADVCTACGVAWDDRHYEKDGICVMCGAGDTVCSNCGREAECWNMLCPTCTTPPADAAGE